MIYVKLVSPIVRIHVMILVKQAENCQNSHSGSIKNFIIFHPMPSYGKSGEKTRIIDFPLPTPRLDLSCFFFFYSSLNCYVRHNNDRQRANHPFHWKIKMIKYFIISSKAVDELLCQLLWVFVPMFRVLQSMLIWRRISAQTDRRRSRRPHLKSENWIVKQSGKNEKLNYHWSCERNCQVPLPSTQNIVSAMIQSRRFQRGKNTRKKIHICVGCGRCVCTLKTWKFDQGNWFCGKHK